MNKKQLQDYCSEKSITEIEKEYIEKIEKQFESKIKALETRYNHQIEKLQAEKQSTIRCKTNFLQYAKDFKSSRELIKYFSEKMQTIEGFELEDTPDWNVSYGYFYSENKLNQCVSCTFDLEHNHVWFSVHAECMRLHGLSWSKVTTKKQIDDIAETVRSVVAFWAKMERFCQENHIKNIQVGKFYEKNAFEYGYGVRLKLPKATKAIEFNAYTNTCQCIDETTSNVEHIEGLFNVIQSYAEKI